MANNTASIAITQLDFDPLKAAFIQYLQNQTVFSSYAFDGAAMNVLIDLLCRNTTLLAYYLNTIASEMFLDSASLRDSIVSRAKEIGYVPRSRASAVANVSILVTPPSNDPTAVLTIPKYTGFQSEAVDGVNYTFVTLSAFTATKNVVSNTFTFPAVDLYEGEHLTYTYTATPATINAIFPIPSANVDTETLAVTVQNSALDTNTTVFLENTDITTLNSNSAVYFVEAMRNNQYGVYFGDGYLGKPLANGNLVILDYLAADGSAPNGANTFVIMGTIGSFSNIQVATNSAADGGADPETNDTIKFRAPISYVRQNRNVTAPDYLVAILDQYPNIDKATTWGGEDNNPPVYGKIFISLKPKSGFVVTNAEKQRIVDALIADESVVGITPEIVDPNFLFLLVTTTVYFNPSVTTLTATEIAQAVTTSITNYNTTTLGAFDSTYADSSLSAAIVASDQSIRNADLSVRLQKQFTPTLNTSFNYTIDFGTELHRGGPRDKLASYPAFSITDSQGVLRPNCFIEEVPESFTGIDEIQVLVAGDGFIETPDIVITGDGSGAAAHAVIQNGKLLKVVVDNAGSEYSVATATAVGGSGTGVVLQPVLSQRNGTLRTFYLKDDGEKVILNATAGAIDYDAGVVSLMNFKPVSIASNPYYPAGMLTLSIEPENQTIVPEMNRITMIDTTNPVAISVTPVSI